MILDRWVDPEEITKCVQGAPKEAITIAAQLTGLKLNEVVGLTLTF
jgi:hypothetical protein